MQSSLRGWRGLCAAVVASAAYVLSATMLWGFSEGRLSFLVVLATLPLAWDRIDSAFARRAPERPFRFGVGLGVALSIGAAFAPAIVLPVGLFVQVDVTDEDGIRAVQAAGGFGIRVGPGRSEARYRLVDTDAVADWLARAAADEPSAERKEHAP